MWTLYHFPLCPFSRKTRLALSEKEVGFDPVSLYPWDAPDDFNRLLEESIREFQAELERD